MDFKELKELLTRNRSYRRFNENIQVSSGDLRDIVSLATLTASGRNLQPLKYVIVNDKNKCDEIFPALAWAGYLTDWDGPEEGERPAAYLVQCLDLSLTENLLCDDGLQLEALSLGAVAKNLGTCIIKSFNKSKIKEALALPEHLDPRYVLALGVPVEEVVLEPMIGNEIKYWRDEEKVHHVPKRNLSEILVN